MVDNVKAVILDKDGVFVNFQSLWLRVIAYRAQLIAEYITSTWEKFNLVRTACIRSMGVDEDDETIDPLAPCSMPFDMVRTALETATYLAVFDYDPTIKWKKVSDIVERALQETKEQLDVVELSEPLEGSLEKINEIKSAGLKLGLFTSDSNTNTLNTLKKFDIVNAFDAVQVGRYKDTELYELLCSSLSVTPSETILVSDSPRDLDAARNAGGYAIGVLSGVVGSDNISGLKVSADEVIDSLASLDLSKFAGNKV